MEHWFSFTSWLREGRHSSFKSHIPVKCNSLIHQFLKVFHFSSSSFYRLPPRNTKKGGNYLENCSEISSRHLVHSSSIMFAIQCIHLDTILFKTFSHTVLHCCVPWNSCQYPLIPCGAAAYMCTYIHIYLCVTNFNISRDDSKGDLIGRNGRNSAK